MELLVLKKEVPHKHLGSITEYLIANGHAMGKWTQYFGVHCLADSADCKGYVRSQHKEFEGSIIENYTLIKKD